MSTSETIFNLSPEFFGEREKVLSASGAPGTAFAAGTGAARFGGGVGACGVAGGPTSCGCT